MIPVFDPLLFGDEQTEVARTLSEGNISGTSPTIARFEAQFSKCVGSHYCVAACNGTAALHLSLLALDVSPGDEVILPNFTIISDAIAVTLCGATPVFVDVLEKDWCIDASLIERAITPKTKGIIPVHIYGHSCEMDKIQAIAQKYGLWVLEDAAQAHGGKWRGKPIGTIGNASCYSFYSNKLITTGEGGAVATNDEKLAIKMRTFANLAFDPVQERRFIHLALTHNYRLSSLQAAMGIAQMNHWEELLDLRRKLRVMYQDTLSPISQITLPTPDIRCEPSFWASTILLNDEVSQTIPELQSKLRNKGIDTRRFFYPLHAQPALAKYHQQNRDTFPISTKLFERGLYLPSSSKLTWDEVQLIGKTLRDLLN